MPAKHSLRCWYCKNEWTPRVPSPKGCPACKRTFNKEKGRVPEIIPLLSEQEFLVNIPEARVKERERGVYDNCRVCARNDDDVEGPYVWLNESLCLLHFLEAILEFDETYNYKKTDAIGLVKRHQTGMRNIIKEILSGLEPSGLTDDKGWENVVPV